MKTSITRSVLIFICSLSAFWAIGCGGETEDTPAAEDMGTDAIDEGAGSEAGMGDPMDASAPPSDTEPGCDCPRDLVCDDMGECAEVSPCESDQQCTEGRICVEGECTDGCADDAECMALDPNQPLCIDGRCGMCGSDDDCFRDGMCDVDARQCIEPDTCSDSRECNGNRVCAAGECEDPFDCRDEGAQCPPGQECTESGACVIDASGSCDSDGDCAVIGHVCLEDGRDARCGPCREDADCPDGQSCRVQASGNRCVEPDVCGSDGECLGTRICEEGRCTAPMCQDDNFEDNEDADSATPIIAGVLRDLVSCGGDVDWFVVTLPAQHAATVSVRQLDNGANLTLSVLNSGEVELGRSASDQPVEALVVGPFPSEQSIFIVVGQEGPEGTARYGLEVELLDEGSGCIDDAYENGVGDDTIETGRQVRAPGELGFGDDLSGRICSMDSDFICFHAAAREQVSIHLDVTAGDAVINAQVYRPNGDAAMASQFSRQGGEAISFRAGAGVYCVELTAESGSGAYRLTMRAVPTAVARVCEEATPLILDMNGDASVQAQLNGEDAMSPLCAAGTADSAESVYTVTFDENDDLPLLLTASVVGLPSGTFGDPVVSIRSDCGDGSTEMACSTGSRDPMDPNFFQISPATVRMAITEPGDYSIWVDGVSPGARPTYRLQVSTDALAMRPANDTCDAANELAFNPNGVTVFGVNLDQASDAVGTCVGERGGDAIYRITVVERARIRLQAAAVDDAFAVTASLSRDCGERDGLACGFGFETDVEPGDYFLVIDGVDANSRGRVNVQMVVETVPQSPGNETCDDAENLALEGGQLNGDTSGANDDYQLLDANLCTGHNTLGGDLAYRIEPETEGLYFVELTPVGGWDAALYVVSDCANPARNRIRCSDGALTESAVFTPQAGEPVYVLVDGSNGESGEFGLRWGPAACRLDVDCPSGACVDYQCID